MDICGFINFKQCEFNLVIILSICYVSSISIKCCLLHVQVIKTTMSVIPIVSARSHSKNCNMWGRRYVVLEGSNSKVREFTEASWKEAHLRRVVKEFQIPVVRWGATPRRRKSMQKADSGGWEGLQRQCGPVSYAWPLQLGGPDFILWFWHSSQVPTSSPHL